MAAAAAAELQLSHWRSLLKTDVANRQSWPDGAETAYNHDSDKTTTHLGEQGGVQGRGQQPACMAGDVSI